MHLIVLIGAIFLLAYVFFFVTDSAPTFDRFMDTTGGSALVGPVVALLVSPIYGMLNWRRFNGKLGQIGLNADAFARMDKRARTELINSI